MSIERASCRNKLRRLRCPSFWRNSRSARLTAGGSWMRTLEPIIISGDQTGTLAFTIGSPEIRHSLGEGSQLGYAGGSDGSGRSPGATIPLVPRRTFFRNPDRTNVQLSSDGAHLAWPSRSEVSRTYLSPRRRIRHERDRLHMRRSDRSLAISGPTPTVTS